MVLTVRMEFDNGVVKEKHVEMSKRGAKKLLAKRGNHYESNFMGIMGYKVDYQEKCSRRTASKEFLRNLSMTLELAVEN